jgi:hypothetical protein
LARVWSGGVVFLIDVHFLVVEEPVGRVVDRAVDFVPVRFQTLVGKTPVRMGGEVQFFCF